MSNNKKKRKKDDKIVCENVPNREIMTVGIIFFEDAEFLFEEERRRSPFAVCSVFSIELLIKSLLGKKYQLDFESLTDEKRQFFKNKDEYLERGLCYSKGPSVHEIKDLYDTLDTKHRNGIKVAYENSKPFQNIEKDIKEYELHSSKPWPHHFEIVLNRLQKAFVTWRYSFEGQDNEKSSISSEVLMNFNRAIKDYVFDLYNKKNEHT